ncbi:MAG: hypothetical protein HC927_12520 [Deltaproteobacteria bacterium]|nr:hypothetical protein [Deltaproteobacteria bacterium]
MTNQGGNKRRTPRYGYQQWCEFVVIDADGQLREHRQSPASDLSTMGMCLMTAEPVEPGWTLVVKLPCNTDPERDYYLAALRAKWCELGRDKEWYRVGGEFITPPDFIAKLDWPEITKLRRAA